MHNKKLSKKKTSLDMIGTFSWGSSHKSRITSSLCMGSIWGKQGNVTLSRIKDGIVLEMAGPQTQNHSVYSLTTTNWIYSKERRQASTMLSYSFPILWVNAEDNPFHSKSEQPWSYWSYWATTCSTTFSKKGKLGIGWQMLSKFFHMSPQGIL